MTLADICASSGISVARGVRAGNPTINLALDFVAPARIGQWIQADVHLTNVKRRFGFCSGAIVNSEGVVARFNGTFYLPDHKGMIKPGAIGDAARSFLDGCLQCRRFSVRRCAQHVNEGAGSS
jgi:acyl-CoA thioesterase FadM